MPIAQDRMLKLLKAAQDYKQALEQVVGMLQEQDSLVQSGHSTHAQAWSIAAISANAIVLLTDPVNSPGTIIAETVHFRHNYKRNQRKAKKMRENREYQKAGLPRPDRSSTAPQSIYRPGLLVTESILQKSQAPAEEPPEIIRHVISTDHKQVQADSDLFGDEDSMGPVTVPGPATHTTSLTPAQMAAIEEQSRIEAERRDVLRRLGLDTTDPSTEGTSIDGQ